MLETRKVTAHLPRELLESLMEGTGMGVTETLREGLKRLAHERACKKLLSLRGKVKFKYTAAELRGEE
jgi:hypothetical protein